MPEPHAADVACETGIPPSNGWNDTSMILGSPGTSSGSTRPPGLAGDQGERPGGRGDFSNGLRRLHRSSPGYRRTRKASRNGIARRTQNAIPMPRKRKPVWPWQPGVMGGIGKGIFRAMMLVGLDRFIGGTLAHLSVWQRFRTGITVPAPGGSDGGFRNTDKPGSGASGGLTRQQTHAHNSGSNAAKMNTTCSGLADREISDCGLSREAYWSWSKRH